ncbi:MAG: hypothetical protein Fur0032_04250 [Terrimicrobiaceae bacterium]
MIELTPRGYLICPDVRSRWAGAFREGESAGLVALGGEGLLTGALPEELFWKGIGGEYLRKLCHAGETASVEEPGEGQLAEWVLEAPPMRGGEYLSKEVLAGIWRRLAVWVAEEVGKSGGIAEFLGRRARLWARVGRVTLHLAENARDPEFPFAFMASYASGVTGAGRVLSLPLAKALEEFGGSRNKAALLKLLVPLNDAAKLCPLMASLLESGDVFHPLAWTPDEAYAFLKNAPTYEEAGLIVRIPDWWKQRGARPRVAATIGGRKSPGVGLESLLDFQLQVEVDGDKLSKKEIEDLLAGRDGLVAFRGRWIEVDRAKLQEALSHWEALGSGGKISFIEGMRLLAGAPSDLRSSDDFEHHREWAFARAGGEIEKLMDRLLRPPDAKPPAGLKATLRPYQIHGVNWLSFCGNLGLGVCLADDMGLGKTVQVLAALQRRKERGEKGAALLVVPASLIGNWMREAARFVPDLRLHLAHPSASGNCKSENHIPADADIVITTYGVLTKSGTLSCRDWGWVVLDEAQAIKNPAAKQSQAVKQLKAKTRVALTGTPVENRVGDLWSIFDFLNPGLLGSIGQFSNFVKKLGGENASNYAPLRRLVAPYILRRLKTDRSVIDDLPAKTEMKVFCGLTPGQAKLYADSAKALARALGEAEGIERRGLVLAYLMRFKQICNHPDQVAQSGEYEPSRSAKFLRLGDICGEIASRGEKVLVFTQFRELTDPLAAHLQSVFGRGGLVLHGGTPVGKRQRMVEDFQRDDGPPFFVLSLKAGGTGLNLVAASHVVHFDRWWNPAVENQATDRAFRIGQKACVLVHKFVTTGTLEEKIDALLEDKQSTADAILSDGAEKKLTEMTNEELLDFVRLDMARAEAAA